MHIEGNPVSIGQKLNNAIGMSEIRRIQQTFTAGRNWDILNSSLFGEGGISRDFFETLNFPEHTYKENADHAMEVYLRNHFKEKKEGIVFVEMGGSGEKLARDINKICPVKKSFGMTLPIGVEMAIDKDKLHVDDIPSNHTIMMGDMFFRSEQEKLKCELGGEKIDLLIERMRGGTDFLGEANCFPAWYYKHLNNWYKLMSDNGVMFVEVPGYVKTDFPYVKNWYRHLQNTKGLDFASNHNQGFFRLSKLPDAPKQLPSSISVIKEQLKNI